ncbi:MAG TPA: nuclease [Sulfurimonas autotrophica]|nr:nuclease [Sulfurimonas autotrophica]
MPPLRTRNIFISHAWNYNEHYWKVVKWLDEAQNFSWENHSVPEHDSCKDDTTIQKLQECMDKQIGKSNCVVIFAGMYAAYSDWIEYEIREAYIQDKTIIGVKPWGQEKMPQIIQDYADEIVGWNQASVVGAIRKNT